jgi:hypothetical protein
MPSPVRLQQPILMAELEDWISDFLHDCPKDLKVCALVCRHWLLSGSHHIRIVIREGPIPGSTLKDFRNLMDDAASTLSLSTRHLFFELANIREAHEVFCGSKEIPVPYFALSMHVSLGRLG